MSDPKVVEGVCGSRPATLALHGDALEIRQAGVVEPRRVPLGDAVQVTLTERGATGIFGTAGVFLLALGALWGLSGSASPVSAGIAAGLGALLLAVGFALRVSVVEIASPEGPLAFACRGRQRTAARELVETLRLEKPERAKPSSASVSQFLQAELRALGATEAERRREYRLVAGARASPEMEARFVRARGKIAAWNLLWTLAIPIAGAAATFVATRGRTTTESLLATMIVLVALVFVGLKILPRTQGVLARLLQAGAPR